MTSGQSFHRWSAQGLYSYQTCHTAANAIAQYYSFARVNPFPGVLIWRHFPAEIAHKPALLLTVRRA